MLVNTKAKVGVFSIALGAYLPQFLSLIHIQMCIRDSFWTSLISGTRMAAQECGAELEVLAPEREQDVEVQNKLLEEAIEKNPDAILFSPSSFDASDELLQKAKDCLLYTSRCV